MTIKLFFGDDNKAYVQLSGNDTRISYQLVNHCASLSEFRRLIGYSDQQHDDATAAHQSALRANSSHDPVQSADIVGTRSRLESRIMPGKSQCYHPVPQLLSLAFSLQHKDPCAIDKIFASDHSDGFTVYKVASTGKWSLLHALVAALTIRYPSFEFSALDLYYFYKKAAEYEPINQVSTAGPSSPASAAAHDYVFRQDIAAQAINDYMFELGLPSHALVLIRPEGEETKSLSDMFTTFPRRTLYWAVPTARRRVWLMHTENEDPRRSHFNVVMKYDPELSHSLILALNKLESEQSWDYGSRIRLLEADLMDQNVSMTSLTLEETRELFHESAAARFEHMNRADFISNKSSPAAEQSCLDSEESA